MCDLVSKYPKLVTMGRGETNRHNLIEEVINKALVWTYFDKPSQGNPPKGGVRGSLYLSFTHCISLKYDMGHESNNLYELMALKLLLQTA
jgi:hypothetical protein